MRLPAILQPRVLREALRSLFSRPFTTRFPAEPFVPDEAFRGRPRFVEEGCVGCGACARFHRDSYDALFREYVETGKVRWTLVPFVSGQFPHSMEAAEAGVRVAAEPDETAAMALQMLADEALSTIGKAGRDFVMQQYHWDTNLARVGQLLEAA